MSTTSITSGIYFIGKTLIIGSTGLANRNYSRILDFNNNSTNAYIYAMYQFSNQYPWVGFKPIDGGESTIIYPYSALIERYYIYVLSFISTTEIKYNIYEYNILASTITSKGNVTTFNTVNTFLSSLTHFWLGRSAYDRDYFYNGRYDKVTLYNGNLFALSDANILSTLLNVVTSTQTNIINDSTTYTFRSLGTNFLGVVVNIINYNTTTGYNVTTSNITLLGSGSSTTIGGYLNIIGLEQLSATIPTASVLYNLNTPNKQWNMYLNTLSSISGDDLTIKPDTRRNLLLEVSGNNNIIIKRGNVSYNLSSLIIGDISFSNFDISNNINPVTNNNGSLGTSSKLWGNAYIRDISVTNMSVSGTISTFREIIPQIANNTSLGNSSNMWQKAFIRDLSGITRINSTNWPIIGPSGATGQNGTPGGPGPPGPSPPGPPGPPGALVVSINTTLTDISNLRITTKNRIYQDISGGINDLSWAAVNGYYGLAKNAYPSLNPLSSGDLAVKTLTTRNIGTNGLAAWNAICWSPELGIFVVGSYTGIGIMTSRNGVNWTTSSVANGESRGSIVWSSLLKIFVAVFWNGYASTSTDGINWIQRDQFSNAAWYSVCWAPEIGLFVAVGLVGTNNRVMTSSNGLNWTRGTNIPQSDWYSVVWSPELRIFVVMSVGGINYAMTSRDGINWTMQTNALFNYEWRSICWSPQLGIFVAIGQSRSLISNNGIDWNIYLSSSGVFDQSICWSPELELFFSTSNGGSIATSNNGIIWTARVSTGTGYRCSCWSPELGIFVSPSIAGYVLTSSLKGRPPTSYNVFDSSFNRIDENGKWDFSNINVTTLTVNNGPAITSDDRLKHNEVNINNGLDVIDKLTPKFYKKTQVLLDASYNGDLSGYAWTLEAGLIAQELLQISDLSFTVGGGDYYEQTYIIRNSNYDLSANNYEVSANNYEPSANNYKLRYNYYEPNANNYEVSANNYEVSANNYEISNNLIAQPYYVNYNSIFVYGLAAIKELHTKVKAQETSILDEQLNDLVTRVEALESNRQDVSNNSA